MKPILMNTEMVKAILAGRKTVTRRVIREQNLAVLDSPYHKEHPEVPDNVLLERLCNLPCQPGDVLYVRETWCKFVAEHIIDGIWYEYKADATPALEATRQAYGYKWHPSIHMPKEAARIFLRVKGVRVERLQDMRLKDCLAEGVQLTFLEENDLAKRSVIARQRYFAVWNSTIKKADLAKYGWEANPWVFVIEFERISKEEALKNATD